LDEKEGEAGNQTQTVTMVVVAVGMVAEVVRVELVHGATASMFAS